MACFDEKVTDGISISFELANAHETGSLYHALGFIIYNSLNMTKIESRPIQGDKWRYRFFIDFDGNIGEAPVQDALRGMAQDIEEYDLWFSGCCSESYPECITYFWII